MWAHVIRFMPRRMRQARIHQLLEQLEAWEARIHQLLEQLEAWEADGRDLVAQLIELTDQGDDIHLEARSVLEHLER